MKAIVFDWDGTLADTLKAHFAANRVVMAALALPFDEALYRSAYSPDWRVMYARLGVPLSRLDEANARWHEALEAQPPVAAISGSVQALAHLREERFAVGLVTASRRSIAAPQVVELGFEGLFEALVFGDDVPETKPHPAPLLRVLDDMGLGDDPRDAVYVGDAPDDMRMARAVSARGVGIESLLGVADDLLDAGAAEVAPSVAAWTQRLLSTRRASRSRLS